MRQELRETAVYNTIIEAVALGNTKLNDIFQTTQIAKNKLTVYLKNLIDLGIVRRDIMATDRDKNQFILGECKFKNSALDLAELTSTIAKFRPKKNTAKVHYYLFSKGGFVAEVQ